MYISRNSVIASSQNVGGHQIDAKTFTLLAHDKILRGQTVIRIDRIGGLACDATYDIINLKVNLISTARFHNASRKRVAPNRPKQIRAQKSCPLAKRAMN